MFEPYQTPASTAPAPNKTPAFFGFTRIPPSVANLDPTHVATLKTGVQTRGVRAAIGRRLEVQWARIQVVELIIYSEGQSLRTPCGKNKEVAFPYICIHIIYIYTLYTYNYIYIFILMHSPVNRLMVIWFVVFRKIPKGLILEHPRDMMNFQCYCSSRVLLFEILLEASWNQPNSYLLCSISSSHLSTQGNLGFSGIKTSVNFHSPRPRRHEHFSPTTG